MKSTGSPRSSSSFPVIGIGASAGGLEAAQSLLDAIGLASGSVKTGMAFILIQHLDPSHNSLMAELLAGHTALTVQQAKDGQRIEREHLYLIPPGMLLSVTSGTLRLTSGEANAAIRLPFDHLLASMAADLGPRAVAVVLTGTGSDGSAGVRAIRAAGGAVMAQDPNEAAFNGMPRSAIATGEVSVVARLTGLANALIENASILRHARPVAPAAPSGGLPDIIDLLRKKTKHDFSHYKPGTMQRRIERRISLLPGPRGTMTSYLELLKADATELDLLSQDLLINVTRFFRDAEVFQTLETDVLPGLIRDHLAQTPIRVWIAGCSTGEEAYSFAILFQEALMAAKSALKVQIFASDADAEMLVIARNGHYADTKGVSAERLAMHFTADERGHRVAADLRAMIVFTQQDLLIDPPFARLDLISCRNLMIYLDTAAQTRVLSLFHFALVKDGLLLLGKAETAREAGTMFAPVSDAARLYRNNERVRSFGAPSLSDGMPARQKGAPEVVVPRKEPMAEMVRRLVLETRAPATILVNAGYECLYMLGPTDRFFRLASGAMANTVIAMARDGLGALLRDALGRSARGQVAVTLAHKRLREDDDGAWFTLNVTPVMHDNQPLFLICLTAEVMAPAGIANSSDSAPDTEQRRDLAFARADLASALGDLDLSLDTARVAREEALSVSEEHQAANEELLASQEELQSLNEELTALNSQLQETLERQRTTSDDLQNVLFSTDVATLFLDTDFCIRFFTPATRAMFSLRPGDIGRPLADLSPLSSDTTILNDARSVLADQMPVEREIEGRDDTWFRRRILPYKTQGGQVEGVVVTYADVTERRKINAALGAAERTARLANTAKTRFLAVASHDLRQPLQTMVILQGLLAGAVTSPRATDLLTRLEETLISMGRMLDVLLDINQIEAGVIQPEKVLFPINTIFARLRNEFAYTARARGLELRKVPCGLTVYSDPALVEQMLRNLISNALKYTRHGKVLIGARRRKGVLVIEVWDTGMGIEDSEITAIFEEYHQVNNPARERGHGLGLGLNIVQRLAALLDHKVQARSVLGRGSCFSVEIPLPVVAGLPATVVLAQIPLSTPEPLGPEPLAQNAFKLPAAIKGAKILIVEDDPEVRDLLDLLLRDQGHRTQAAEDGPSAVALMASGGFAPDLILSDYNLPGGMDGLVLTAELRRMIGRPVPVILLTGDISTEAMRRIAQNDVLHLAKPVTVARLARAVADLLGPVMVPAPGPVPQPVTEQLS